MSNKRTVLLKMTDDVKKAIGVPFKVRKDKKTLESWIIDKEQKIAELDDAINTLKGKDSLGVDNILDKVDELALTKRRLQQGEELLKELFEEPYTQEEDAAE